MPRFVASCFRPAALSTSCPTMRAFLDYRWYREAFENSETFSLPNGDNVRIAKPIYFAACKIEAIHGRAKNDYLASHDLEDLCTVLSALPLLTEQIKAGSTGVAQHVQRELQTFAEKPGFLDAIVAHFYPDEISQDKAARLVRWIEAL
jgi:hypothetical protein